MKSHLKTLLIGLFVAIACAILIGMILFFEPTVGDGKQTLLVRFANINGITIGTRVNLAGKPIGDVVSIQQIPNAREQPTDEIGQVYFYQLTCHVDSSVKVYTTDEITVQTSGLLGEKSVSILPKKAPTGIIPKRATAKTPLYGQSADPFEYAFYELSSLADKMEDTLEKVGDWIDDNGDAMGSAVRSFDDAMSEVSQAVAEANHQNLIDKVTGATTNFSNAMTQVNDAIAQMDDENTFKNLGVTMRNLKNTSYSVEDIAADIADGRGTLGKIIKGDDLYLRFNAVLNKVNTLLNDVNQYGLLFNLNKQWQRVRVKRASAIGSLDSPSEFKAYVEQEIDMMTTSMERITMALDRAENRPCVMQSDAFMSEFAELLRSVDALQGNLKLYNQELMDREMPPYGE